MLYHFIKLLLLSIVVFICIPLSVFIGLVVSVVLNNAHVGYGVTVVLFICTILFAAIEGIITIYQMVRMLWR